MGKDFRVGLITGVVLAGAALVWVATRPSLSLKAGVPQPSGLPPEARQAAQAPLPWENAGDAEANRPQQAVAQEPPPTQAVAQPVQESVPAAAPSTPAASSPTPAIAAATSTAPPAAGDDKPDLTVYSAQPIKTTRFHIVRKGDTLSTIAQQYLGSSSRWRQILTANAKTIKDPNKIAPGTKLIIPD